MWISKQIKWVLSLSRETEILFKGRKRLDEVLQLNGDSISLIEWLTLTYPKIFSSYNVPGTPGWVLKIQHPKGVSFPNLEEALKLKWSGYYQFREDGFVVPKLIFEEQSKGEASLSN